MEEFKDEEILATDSETIDTAINQVLDTFKFHGITITSVNLLKEGYPSVNIRISKQKMYRTLDDTLNFAYWTLWTLFYGSYDKSKDQYKLELNYYEEVE